MDYTRVEGSDMLPLITMQVLLRPSCSPERERASGTGALLAEFIAVFVRARRSLSFQSAWLMAILVLALLPTSGTAGATDALDKQLLTACRNGDRAKVLSLLEKGANVNTLKDWSWTPLRVAIENGDLGIVQLLIEKGADVNAKDESGHTPLMRVCREW